MEASKASDITLRDLLRVFFRHKLIIVGVFFTILPMSYMGLELRTPMYESSVKILVTSTMQKDVEFERDLGPGFLLATQMVLATSNPILERTVKSLELDQLPIDYEKRFTSNFKQLLIDRRTKELIQKLEKMPPKEKKDFLFIRAVNQLRSRISVEALGDETSIFLINVRDFNPVTAAIIANVVSRSYVIFDIEQQIAELQLTYGMKNSTIIKLENHIKMMEEFLDGKPIPDIEALGPASVKIIGQAQYGELLPMKPGKTGGLAVAFIMSLTLGVAIAYGIDYFDHTFRSGKDVDNFLMVPFLGSVAKKKRKEKPLIEHINPATKYTQTSQYLSEHIYLSMKAQDIRSLLIVDTEGSEGTVALIGNVGRYIASQSHLKVLIIDANLRGTTRLADIFNIASGKGLTEVIEEKIPFEEAIMDLGSDLFILPAGNSTVHPISLLESPMMKDVIRKAKSQYEIVFLNSSDLSHFKDAAKISILADGTALVINEGEGRRQTVINAISPLMKSGVNIIGAILNNRKDIIPEIIYKHL